MTAVLPAATLPISWLAYHLRLCWLAYSEDRPLNKLSYRKQVARQLRTQYVEGICSGSIGQGSLKVTGNGTIG